MSRVIEEAKKRAKLARKAKKNQVPYGLALLGVLAFIFVVLADRSSINALLWVLGILLGVVLQKCRFCFAAAFRDPVLVGSTSVMRGVIICLIITTIGFGLVQYMLMFPQGFEDIPPENIPGRVRPVGFHTIIGGVLFGIGMVVAGGCASGTLMRIGEGYLMQLVVLVGFIIGTLWGAWDYPLWDNLFIQYSPVIYLPYYFGFKGTVVGQVIFLLLIYYLAYLYDKKNSIMAKL